VRFGADCTLYSLWYEVSESSNSKLLSDLTCACQLPLREFTTHRRAAIDSPALSAPVSRRAPLTDGVRPAHIALGLDLAPAAR